MNHLQRMGSLVVLIVLAVSVVPQRGSAQSGAVPEWLAWKVFHQSLAFYEQRSTHGMSNMLSAKFGVRSTEATALTTAGESYVAAIERIDADARAQVQAKWGDARPLANLPTRANGRPAPPGHPIVLERGKTLVQMARESGLYDQIEARKNAALATHLGELAQTLGVARMTRVADWVRWSVAPQVTIVERAARVRRTSGLGR